MGRPDVSADVIVGLRSPLRRVQPATSSRSTPTCDAGARWRGTRSTADSGSSPVTTQSRRSRATATRSRTSTNRTPPTASNYQGEMGVPRPEGQPPLGHRRGRRPLPPGAAAGAHPVLLHRAPSRRCGRSWSSRCTGSSTSGSPTARMDLVLDYASPVPAILTMRLMGLPYDNWQLYANLFHSVMDASEADRATTRRSPKSPR